MTTVAEPETTVDLRVIQHGETTVKVPQSVWMQMVDSETDHTEVNFALVDSALDAVETAAGAIEADVTAIAPDGIAVPVGGLHRRPYRSFVGRDVEKALADFLANIPRDQVCAACTVRRGPCPQHMARALAEACRNQRLVIIPEEAGDDILRQVRNDPFGL